MAETLSRGAHITDKERTKLAKAYAKRYNKGESVRAIAEEQGRSFGFVHALLKAGGVELRKRGTQKGTRLGPRGPRSKPADSEAAEVADDGSSVDPEVDQEELDRYENVTESNDPVF